MWILMAVLSAFFAGITSITAKCGIKKTNSDVATAIRTIIVLIFAWLMVFITGAQTGLSAIGSKTLLFLILSGFSTGASWLCYFRALQLGDINKVVPVDKSSTVLTIILSLIFFQEFKGFFQIAGTILIAVGTILMIQKKESGEEKSKTWLLYAVLSAVFASLTSIFGKIGISGIDSNLGTAIRTCIVLVMAWLVVFIKGEQKTIRHIEKKELFFISLSGLSTGASWLCYFKALQDGKASVVVPIDKLSILITIAFSYLVFGEKLTKKAVAGLTMIVAGTLFMLL